MQVCAQLSLPVHVPARNRASFTLAFRVTPACPSAILSNERGSSRFNERRFSAGSSENSQGAMVTPSPYRISE